jgi:DNA-binding beta-propeller fold protein YncE
MNPLRCLIGVTALAMQLPLIACSPPAESITSINVGANPTRIVASPNGRFLYVLNSGGHTISVIDTDSLSVNDLDVGQHPSDLSIAPNGSTLFVVDSEGATLTAIDAVRGSRKWTERIPHARLAGPISLNQEENGTKLVAYVSVQYDDSSDRRSLPKGYLAVIDLTTPTAQGPVTFDTPIEISNVTYTVGCPEGSAITPNGKWLYLNTQCLATQGPGSDPMFVIDTEAKQVQNTVDFALDHLPNVGSSVAMRPDGAQVWAGGGDACTAPSYNKEKCAPPGGNPVTIVRTADHKIVKQLFYGAPNFITFTPDSKIAYIATSVEILGIDTDTFQVVRHIAVQNASGSMVFSMDGHYAYATVAAAKGVVVRFRTR